MQLFFFAIVLDFVMRQVIDGKEEELGFKLDTSRSREHPQTVVTNTDFSDDIALITEKMNQVQELLNND